MEHVGYIDERLLEALDNKVFKSAMQWGKSRYVVQLEEWEAEEMKKLITDLTLRNESLLAENGRLNNELAPCADTIGKLMGWCAGLEAVIEELLNADPTLGMIVDGMEDDGILQRE